MGAAQAFVADSGAAGSNSALTGLSSVAGDFELQFGAALSLTGGLTVGGSLNIDTNNGGSTGSSLSVGGDLSSSGTVSIGTGFRSDGGSTLTITGNLSNSGTLNIHDDTATATVVTASTLTATTGSINLLGDEYGDGTGKAELVLTSGAAPSSLSSTITLYGPSLLEFASGGISSIATGGKLVVGGAQAFVADSGATGSNSALTALSSVSGDFELQFGAALSVTGGLTVGGSLNIDTNNGGSTGSSLSVGGDLSNSGTVSIGTGFRSDGGSTLTITGNLSNSGTLNIHDDTATATVVTASTLTATTGTINLLGDEYGDGTGAAELILTSGAAPSSLSSTITLYGPSLLQFASGGISSIAAGGKLVVGAAQAFVADSGATGSNSALTGLSSVSGDFELQFGAALSVTGGLTVGGSLNIDTNNGGSTGSSLSVGGDLSNSGTVSIGTGFRSDGGSTLTITGNLSNSGTLNIHDDTATATVVTASTLTATTGTINLLGDEYGDGTGAAELILTSGAAPSSLSSTITLYGPSLLQFASGGISSIAAGGKLVVGAAQAFVADSGAAGSNSALTGLGSVAGDFELQFGAALSLTGGLTVGGSLNIDTNNGGSTGSSLSVGGDLSNSGTVSIGTGFRSDGGSTLTISGNLSNSGTLNIHDDTATATVVTASTLTATTGSINLLGDEYGDGTGKAEVVLTSGAAPSSLSSTITLFGPSLLEFASGGISSIAAGGKLVVGAAQAFVADSGATGSNSALTGLSSVSGDFELQFGAALSLTGGLTVGGSLNIDTNNGGSTGSSLSVGGDLSNSGTVSIGTGFRSDGGSTLTITGNLSNSGTLNIHDDTATATVVTASTLTNSGTINLLGDEFGDGTGKAELDVNGAASSSGTISIGSHAELSVTGGNAYTQTGGTTTVTGTLAAATINVNGGLLDFTAALSPGSGTGDINIGGNGTVEFGAAVDAGHKVTFTSAAGTLELGAPNQFTPTIYGFSDGDTIDFLHTAVTAVSYANGVLTAMNGGTTVATINLSGPYFTSDFATSTDNNGGTDVKLGTNPAQATIQETSGDGTLSRNGSNYTLDFGTVKLGANALTADLEVLNSAIAPADALSGSFNIAANAAFTNGGFTAFSGVEAGQADPAPTTITFNTGSGGTFTETITLMPASSNGNGTASLPNETLTVTGTVAPPPAIVAPSNVVVQQGRRSRIAGVSVTDVYAQNTGQAVTVILGDTNGLLSANANASGGGGNIAGNGTSQLTIQGTLAQVNADLGTLTDLDSVLAPDAITINANDGSAAAPTQTVSVGVAISPVITTPFVAVLPQGQATPVMGIGISDVSPTNKTFTVTLADTYGRLSANTNAAGGGGTIKGAGTTVLKISGSLAQVNADLTTLTDTDSSANGDLIAIYANDGTGGIAAVQTVSVATSPSATIDWDSVKAADRPVTVDQADWDNIWTQFKARVGNTTASLSTALSQEATELAQIAQPNNNINSLIQFELLQVVGGLLPTYIAGASELRRQYDGSLLTRNNPGPFGYGWTFAYGISAISDAGGNVSITSAGGTALFTRQSNGSFVAESGRGATLSVTGGAYKLVDANGNVDRFLANGKLSSVTDRNGNTTSLNWDNAGNLLTVTSWTGKSISFTYNGFGRIASATSSNGTQFTYTYDPSGTLLLSATGPNGTTTYAYDATQGSASENALTEITNPDGTHEYLHYNAQGLLSEQYGDNGAGLITYSYTGAGQVTVTDALGDQNILFYGTNGKVARTQDALGNLTKLQYDEIGELTSLIGPDNSTWTYSYSASGGLTSYIDPLGGKVVITYEPGTRLLTGFTDQLGDKI